MRLVSTITIFLLSITAIFSQYSLSGKVFNTAGEYLESAVVYLDGTKHLVSTDQKGNYIINDISEGNYKLTATYLGYDKVQFDIIINSSQSLDIVMTGSLYNLDEIEIQGNRVRENGPFTKKNLSKTQIIRENLGQDAPYIMQWTPSMVVSSDGGTGIGYTNLRMRGSDQTRINVTLNGAPVNDAESHNVFWVDLPNVMASTNDIQIQRGVGTSTNGAGAFGGTISLNTADVKINPFIEADATLGSFGTYKFSAAAGTGLMNNKYTVEGRISRTQSDGYLDRASSQLQSVYFTAAKLTEKSSLRLNVLGGKERTYQAWYGTPAAKLGIGNDKLIDHYYRNVGSIYKNIQDSINLFRSDRRYNYYTYDDQVDDYRQLYIQLLKSNQWNDKLFTKALIYYTDGSGYFEEFKFRDQISDYYDEPKLSPSKDTVLIADVTRQRWLSNDLIGANFDLVYKQNKLLEWQAGIAANKYFGSHYGFVIDLGFPLQIPRYSADQYYINKGLKTDISGYTRAILKKGKFESHVDLQLRSVDYSINGNDNDKRLLEVDSDFLFFNPKIGFSYTINDKQNVYASYAIANKEPIRSDFVDNVFGTIPEAEKLHNIEVGYQILKDRFNFQSNVYYMLYKDQLVLTGNVNDVGAPTRFNVPDSYRLGLEVDGGYTISSKLMANANLSLSRNKINNFTEVLYDYTDGFEEILIDHGTTDISFSPSVISTVQMTYKPIKNLAISIANKYVSKQYLDNTSSEDRIIPAFDYQNLLVEYNVKFKKFKKLKFTLMANNIFDRKYVSNGYTYSYIYQETVTENFYYPQAGAHVLFNVSVGL